MTAVDTNVLVRLLTGDDHRQTAAASSLFSVDTIWIAKTVLLETAWVLRSRHRFENDAIANAFTQLLGLDNVHVEDESSVVVALALTTHGIDLADALHLSSRPPGSTFVSFDRPFIRRAQRAGAADISEVSPKP
jgi:predicted nucleic-acid-binding protein